MYNLLNKLYKNNVLMLRNQYILKIRQINL